MLKSATWLDPGRGGVLRNFYTYVGSGIFFGFKILNFNVFGGFWKMNIFWYEDFVDMFWGHHKIDLYLGVISVNLRVFS